MSGKTDYLVAGFEMEDGRKITEGAQYKAAVKKKVNIISDEDLMKVLYLCVCFSSDLMFYQAMSYSLQHREQDIMFLLYHPV